MHHVAFHVLLCEKYKPRVSGTGSVIAFTLRTRFKNNLQLGPAGKDILNTIPNLSGFISNIDDRKTEKKQMIPSRAPSKYYRRFISTFGE